MNIESFQDTLFADPVGLRLKHAREKERLSKEAVAQQLKFPVSVIEAIEREDWPRLGAPIFVRSYIGSYARLLGLPSTLADEAVRDKPAPALEAVGNGSPARRLFDRGLMNLAYLVMTVVIAGLAIALAVHYQAAARLTPASASALSLDVPTPASLVPTGDASVSLPDPVVSVPTVNSVAAPVMASLAPPLPPAPTPNAHELQLRFRGESWIDATDLAGTRIERGLVPAGSERRYELGQISRIVLGDANAVEASLGPGRLDLAPFRDVNDAKVARFAVSSDGKLVAVAN